MELKQNASTPPPPQCHSQPFLPAHFPLLSQAQVHTLTTQGYATFPISQRVDLHDAASALFDVARAFFAQSQTDKANFQVDDIDAPDSEEGWARAVGEKELLTLRRASTCPPGVESQGSTLWRECGALMQEVIHGIEQSLGLRQGALDDIVVPECVMPGDGADRIETLLRMFRYERRCGQDNSSTTHSDETSISDKASDKGRLVAESHCDLGLLSLVIGASPGLEVLDTTAGGWLPIEQPPYACPGTLTATLLVGETLTRLTNGRYVPGQHRVFPRVRFAMISTSALTTAVTGPFQHPLKGVPPRTLLSAITGLQWNANAGPKHPEAQMSRSLGNGRKLPWAWVTNGYQKNHHDHYDDQQLDAERSASRIQTLYQSLTRKRQRLSHSIFNSNLVPPEGDHPRRMQWLTFKRLPR